MFVYVLPRCMLVYQGENNGRRNNNNNNDRGLGSSMLSCSKKAHLQTGATSYSLFYAVQVDSPKSDCSSSRVMVWLKAKGVGFVFLLVEQEEDFVSKVLTVCYYCFLFPEKYFSLWLYTVLFIRKSFLCSFFEYSIQFEKLFRLHMRI